VINVNNISDKQIRALTCAVIKNALTIVKTTYCYWKLKDIEKWINDDSDLWWNCLEVFCDIDVRKAQKIIAEQVKIQRKKIYDRNIKKRELRIAKIKVNRTAPLLVFRSDRSTQVLCRKGRDRNIANADIGRIWNMGINRFDLHIGRNIQRQQRSNFDQVGQLKLL
jgi:hypothetical protein